ncbi:uncharacterized protein L201_005968 [Kwoniella dendrophila CBS 6074]|uniref:Transcription factor CBF/NF-Y/archaeal histone domain-containing protein n=1 Tax=Kwoniella dendrophila CBS 6074 TaxID=1295534 RepID=A0AAX4K1K0_9TREE
MNPSYFLPTTTQFPSNGSGPSNHAIPSGSGNISTSASASGSRSRSSSGSGSGSGSESSSSSSSSSASPGMNNNQGIINNHNHNHNHIQSNGLNQNRNNGINQYQSQLQQNQQIQQIQYNQNQNQNQNQMIKQPTPPQQQHQQKQYQTQAEQRQALHPQLTQQGGPLILPNQDLNTFLESFWKRQMNNVEGEIPDWKSYNLPLARIKKVMKSDEEVRMISAEAPIMFSKACEIFISELTCRAWLVAESNKRRTLQKSDVAAAIAFSDMFDFLIDIVPRDDGSEDKEKSNDDNNNHNNETTNNNSIDGGDQQQQQHEEQGQSGNNSLIEDGNENLDIDIEEEEEGAGQGQSAENPIHQINHQNHLLDNSNNNNTGITQDGILNEDNMNGDDLYNEYVQED